MADYRKGDLASAERLCRAALERNPRHVPSLVLLGDLVQQGGRNKLAVKLLGQALALDPYDVAAHDNIAMAYQALGRRDEAVRHFTQAVALGLRDPEMLIRHSAAIGASMQRHAAAWPKQLQLSELLEAQGASPVTGEALLVALLQSKPITDFGLEVMADGDPPRTAPACRRERSRYRGSRNTRFVLRAGATMLHQ